MPWELEQLEKTKAGFWSKALIYLNESSSTSPFIFLSSAGENHLPHTYNCVKTVTGWGCSMENAQELQISALTVDLHMRDISLTSNDLPQSYISMLLWFRRALIIG